MAYNGYKIFANHAHVFEEAVRPHGSIDQLKALMDEVGIDKVVAFAPICGGPRAQLSDPDGNQNAWLANAIHDTNDIIGFGTINFAKGDLRGQTEQIAELGLRGIKIHPAYQTVKVNGEQAYEVYEAAERCGLFISFHTGVHWSRLSNYAMLLFDDLTYDFPNLKFSLEHIGGHCFFKEAMAVIANRRGNADAPHVFAGWTDIHGQGGLWSITDEELYDLLNITGPKAQIHGLDFPYSSADYCRAGFDRILSLNIPEETKARILGQNLAEALDIAL